MGSNGSLTFNPPIIADPTDCDSPYPWLYQVEIADDAILDSLQVAVDHENNLLAWETLPLFTGTPTPGTYQIIVNAVLPGDGNFFE